MFSFFFPSTGTPPPSLLQAEARSRISAASWAPSDGSSSDTTTPPVCLVQGASSGSARYSLLMQFAISYIMRAAPNQTVTLIQIDPNATMMRNNNNNNNNNNRGVPLLQVPISDLPGAALDRIKLVYTTSIKHACKLLFSDRLEHSETAGCFIVDTGDLEGNRDKYLVMRLVALVSSIVDGRLKNAQQQQQQQQRRRSRDGGGGSGSSSGGEIFCGVVAVEPSVTNLDPRGRVPLNPQQLQQAHQQHHLQQHLSLCAQLQGLISFALILLSEFDATYSDLESLSAAPFLKFNNQQQNNNEDDASASAAARMSSPSLSLAGYGHEPDFGLSCGQIMVRLKISTSSSIDVARSRTQQQPTMPSPAGGGVGSDESMMMAAAAADGGDGQPLLVAKIIPS